MTDHPELLNAARDPKPLAACVATGTSFIGQTTRAEHDYRKVTDPDADGPGRPRTYLRCVWCHAVACGDASEADPCIEPWHHEPAPHRTALGFTWPIGGNLP